MKNTWEQEALDVAEFWLRVIKRNSRLQDKVDFLCLEPEAVLVRYAHTLGHKVVRTARALVKDLKATEESVTACLKVVRQMSVLIESGEQAALVAWVAVFDDDDLRKLADAWNTTPKKLRAVRCLSNETMEALILKDVILQERLYA